MREDKFRTFVVQDGVRSVVEYVDQHPFYAVHLAWKQDEPMPKIGNELPAEIHEAVVLRLVKTAALHAGKKSINEFLDYLQNELLASYRVGSVEFVGGEEADQEWTDFKNTTWNREEAIRQQMREAEYQARLKAEQSKKVSSK